MQAIMKNEKYEIRKRATAYSISLAGAVGGFSGSLIFLLVGISLSAISYFKNISFGGLETASFVCVFISAALGAHFLDKIERAKKAEVAERRRKMDLKE